MNNLQVGDKVEIVVGQATKLGFIVLVNQQVEGMVYKNEMYQRVSEGERLVAYVKKVREDGKLDLSLQPLGFKQTIKVNESKILNVLSENEGFLPLTDKSSPEEIKYALEMSKKAFKNAIGGLYKQKIIKILPNGILLK